MLDPEEFQLPRFEQQKTRVEEHMSGWHGIEMNLIYRISVFYHQASFMYNTVYM